MKGKKVAICRAKEQSAELIKKAERMGAEAISLPMIQLDILEDLSALHRELDRLETIDWIVFTSSNTVNFFFQAAHQYGVKFYFYPNLKIATVGEKTKSALELLGYRTNFVPIEYTAEVLAENMDDVFQKNILIPRSNLASNEYVEVFNQRKANPIPIDIYKNSKVNYSPSEMKSALSNQIDYLIFTSGSTVKNFHQNMENASLELHKEQVVCIGPSTAKVAKELGYAVAAVAEPHDADGIMNSLKKLENHV